MPIGRVQISFLFFKFYIMYSFISSFMHHLSSARLRKRTHPSIQSRILGILVQYTCTVDFEHRILWFRSTDCYKWGYCGIHVHMQG